MVWLRSHRTKSAALTTPLMTPRTPAPLPETNGTLFSDQPGSHWSTEIIAHYPIVRLQIQVMNHRRAFNWIEYSRGHRCLTIGDVFRGVMKPSYSHSALWSIFVSATAVKCPPFSPRILELLLLREIKRHTYFIKINTINFEKNNEKIWQLCHYYQAGWDFIRQGDQTPTWLIIIMENRHRVQSNDNIL